jgi:glycerophosphoryl diester phosphodiesterase
MKAYLHNLPDPAHISHRGGSLVAPENTLAAFEQARARWNTDVLELDVQPTADGHVVVLHDDTVDRTTNGHGRVDALTLAAVQALDAGFHHPAFRGRGVRISTLEEVLRRFPGVRINLELKRGEPPFTDEVLAILRRNGALERVCLGHLDAHVAERLCAAAPEAATWFPQDAATLFVMCCKGGQEPPADVPYSLLALPDALEGIPIVGPEVVAVARRRGIPVHVWTVDEPAQMQAMLDLGVAGIMTDRPDLLRQVLDQRATR